MSKKENEQTGLLKSIHKEPTSDKGDEDRKDTKKECTSQSLSSLIIGILLLVVLTCSNVVSTAAAQVIGRNTSMFMLNLYRYGFLAILGIVWSSLLKFSVNIEKKDVCKFAVVILLNYVNTTLFYISAAYVPLGNLAGFFTGLYIILTMGMDFMWRWISKISILVLGLALIGITTVSQPWQLENRPNASNQMEWPCDVWDNGTLTNYRNATTFNSNDVMDSAFPDSYWIHPVFLGYIYVAFAAISAAMSNHLSRTILESYNVYCYFFWASVFQTLMSAVMVILLKLLDRPTLSVPSGVTCLSLTVLFICTTVISGVSLTFVYMFLPFANVAFFRPFSVTILYIAQITLLHRFHPGNGNIPEITGIVCIILASLLFPLRNNESCAQQTTCRNT